MVVARQRRARQAFMQANSDRSDRAREHSGLPLTTDPWESRGGSVWVVAGVCMLALAVVFHLKLDPAAARARNGAEEPPAAPSEPPPDAPAPAAAEVEADDRTAAEPATPPVSGGAQAELPSPPSSDKTAAAPEPADSTAPGAGGQDAKPARKSKRASPELQRLRQALTDAANLERPAAQETTTLDSPAVPTPSEPVVAAPQEVPAPAPPAAPGRPSTIPDNPY